MTIEALFSPIVQDRLARFVDRALRDYARAVRSPASGDSFVFVGRPRNRQLAAIVRELEDGSMSPEDRRTIGKFAAAIGNCGQLVPRLTRNGMEEVPLRCRRHLLCRSCAAIRSLQLAEVDAARVLLAYQSDPSLHFALFTFLVPEMEDLPLQLELLRSGIGQLPQVKYQGKPVIVGNIWQIEVAHSEGGQYRAHVHVTAAITNPSLDALVAVLARWVDITRPGLPRDKRRRVIVAQHATLFWAHHTAAVTKAPPVQLELAQDAYAVSLYGSKSRSLGPYESLWAYVGVNGTKLRDTWGVLRGKQESDIERALTEIGGRDCLIRTNATLGDLTSPVPTRAKRLGNRSRRRRRERLHWITTVWNSLGRLEARGRASARPMRGPKARSTGDQSIDGSSTDPMPTGERSEHLLHAGGRTHVPSQVRTYPIVKTTTKTLKAMKKTLINHTSVKPTPTPPKPPAAQAGVNTSDSPDVIHGTKLNSGNLTKPDKVGVFTFVRLDQLQVIPGFNPRSEPGDVSHLAGSIKSEGILSALVVRPAKVSGKFDIIAGARRYLACQQADYDQPIPCIIRTDLIGDDERALAVAMAENSEDGRSNLNMIEIGRACMKLKNRGWPVKRIALEACLHHERVRRALALVSAPEHVRQKIQEGMCSSSAALEALKMDEAERARFMDKLGPKTTVKDVIAFRKKAQIAMAAMAPAVNPPAAKGVLPKLRTVGAWRKPGEKQAALQHLCAVLHGADVDQVGTPDYHEIRGAIACALWDRGDRPISTPPPMNPVPGSKDYAAQMKDLTGFNAVVKAEAAKYVPVARDGEDA